MRPKSHNAERQRGTQSILLLWLSACPPFRWLLVTRSRVAPNIDRFQQTESWLCDQCSGASGGMS
jgi:hypothetical protein